MKKYLCIVLSQKKNLPVQTEAILPLWGFFGFVTQTKKICRTSCYVLSDDTDAE